MDIIIRNTGEAPIYDQITQQVKGLILSGALSEGEALPSMRALAKDLRISVITTKRAYEELEREGFITSVPGKGCFVAPRNLELVRENALRQVEEYLMKAVEAAKAGRAEIALKGKIRTILIPGKLCRKLLKYAKQQKTASGEIFLTRNGTPLSRRQIWAEMKGLCKTAGVAASKVFPHNLRHLFAAAFYRASLDIVKLADVLGHSSLETTRIYLLTSGAEHQRQLDRLGLVS